MQTQLSPLQKEILTTVGLWKNLGVGMLPCYVRTVIEQRRDCGDSTSDGCVTLRDTVDREIRTLKAQGFIEPTRKADPNSRLFLTQKGRALIRQQQPAPQ